ncbi:unnamed protein product [Leptosia nina]|uniref:RING-type domain-containing protein n=1 Tax=Leptosia nina TaxID=320188 RepID=A0AAV1K120_9NEOP
MNIEVNRLNTFSDWPTSAPVDPIRIAKAGFFYTGNETEVECFSCGGKISDWSYGDQVMWRHRLLRPNCSFVATPQLSGNVPSVDGQSCVNNSDTNASSDNTVDGTVTPVRYGLTQEDLMYRSDALRLLSYVNWNDTSISREALVNAGFYHAGGGRLRCAWCGGELAPHRNLGSLGSALEIHIRYFPMCEFAVENTTPYDRERQRNRRIEEYDSISQGENVQGYILDFTPNNVQSTTTTPCVAINTTQTSGTEHNEQVVAAGSTWRDLGVVSGGARHPAKASLFARLSTFNRWPYDRPQAPQSLAEAGFFYTGLEDQVRCFYCDGGLGKWEAGDVPWREHARWFPQCGYVLLLKGQQFVDSARADTNNRTSSADPAALPTRPRNPPLIFPVTDAQIDACMESSTTGAALGAGLDVARVRRAIVRRLRATGSPFPNSESLIDAVLDDQLNEEAWSTVSSQRLARDILAETLSLFDTTSRAFNLHEDRSDSRQSSDSSPTPPLPEAQSSVQVYKPTGKPAKEEKPKTPVPEQKELTLEEENRQLKEARLCKVCMDNEVSIVFLPCGHLVSCASCSTALAACPLCRAAVKALVRAYFA